MINEQIKELTEKLARLATETKQTTQELQKLINDSQLEIVAGDRVQCIKGNHEGLKGTVIRTTKVFVHIRVDEYPKTFKEPSIKKRKSSLRKL
jgi:hypothetical protein